MQFLVEWYQLPEMQFIVQLSVSRRTVSSTVVSADMQFLVVVSTELQYSGISRYAVSIRIVSVIRDAIYSTVSS